MLTAHSNRAGKSDRVVRRHSVRRVQKTAKASNYLLEPHFELGGLQRQERLRPMRLGRRGSLVVSE